MKIDQAEVLRYLGHRGQPLSEAMNALMGDCIALCESTARPLYVYKIFETQPAENGVLLRSASLTLTGADIRDHLKRSSKCAVLAATLGAAVDLLIQTAQLTDMARAVILDACADALIERCCDEITARISRDAGAEGCRITGRFSPGYGDFPLEIQPAILLLLDAQKKIGLTCTQDALMIPRKSITAVVAIHNSQCAMRN